MIKLRKLQDKDIPYMLEWMHEQENKFIFQHDFLSTGEDEIREFIKNSYTSINKHFAIVDESDEYLGTISLKNIDYKNRNAEYAISTRSKIRGTGINTIANKLLLEYAFDELELVRVYLNVLSTNVRAKKFYEKNGFIYEGTFKNHILINSCFEDLDWYGILNEKI